MRNIEYLENRTRFSDEIKKMFIDFKGLSFSEEIKIW